MHIHELYGSGRIGDEGYRGVQDLISDMSLKSVFINLTTSKEYGTGVIDGYKT